MGGALPLGDDEWVVLDLDPDASGLKLDQHLRKLLAPVRQRGQRRPGDVGARHAALDRVRARPAATGRRDPGGRVQEAEELAARRRPGGWRR